MTSTEEVRINDVDDVDDPWVKPQWVAGRLKISVVMAIKFIRQEMPHFCSTNGRHVRVRRSAFDRWEKARTLNPCDHDSETGELLFDPSKIR